MAERNKIRYYYWLILEFLRKNVKLIIITTLISFFVIISAISIFPYIETNISQKKIVMGIIGQHDVNNLPDEITSRLSNGLIFINEKGETLPALASSWEIKDNSREYRFHLKDNLTWNSGKYFLASEINYNLKDVEMKVVDARTVYFKLKKPLPIFITYLKKPIIRYPLDGVAGFYKVKNLRSKYGNLVELQLEPNKKGLPILVYKFFNNESEIITSYKKGEINQMTVTKKSIADVFTQWKNTSVNKNIDYSSLLTIFMNHDNPLLKDREIRQAISESLNRNLYHEAGEPAVGPIPPISWAFSSNLKQPVYNPEAAEKILKKTFTGSNSAELNFYTYYDYLSIADKVIEDLKKVGVKINLNIITYETPKNFDLLMAFWKVPYDPDQYFFWHSTQTQGNIGNYKNVKIDKLLEDGRSTTLPDERKQYYYDFQKTMADDQPALFLYFPYIYTIKRK